MRQASGRLLAELRDVRIDAAGGSVALRRARPLFFALYCVGLGVYSFAVAPPLSLQPLLMWLGAAMLIASVGNPLGWAKGMLIDWLPIYVILITYDIARGLVDNLGITPHDFPQRQFDQLLFGSAGLTDHLQDWLWHPGHPHALDYAAWAIYLSHFFVSLVIGAALWMQNRDAFLAFRRRLLSIWLVAIGIFAAYPTVPPWMSADGGTLPPMTRIIGHVWQSVASTPVDAVLNSGDGRIPIENQVAAVPSMHSAIPMLICLFLWSRWRRGRVLLALYPVLMGLSLVYVGEHYVFDVLAGWALAVVIHVGMSRLESRKRRAPAIAQPRSDDADRDADAVTALI
jgi:membrane-associated phospholipid phosphatase